MTRRLGIQLFALLLGCQDHAITHNSCDVDISGYQNGSWSEPSVPPEASQWMVPSSGRHLFIRWSAEAHVDYATAWLADDEPVSIDVAIAAAANEASVQNVNVVLFADGQQLMLRDPDDQDNEVSSISIPVRAGEVTSGSVFVQAERLETGAHSLVIAILRSKFGDLLLGTHYTVIKGGVFTFSERANAQGGELGSRASEGPYVTSDGAQLYSSITREAPPGGMLPMDLTLQPSEFEGACSDAALPILVVTLVDFEQVEMSGCGPYCRAVLARDEALDLRTSIGLPLDSERHVVSVLQFYGDGLFSEVPLGEPAPWYRSFVDMLGFASFQESS